MRFDSDGLFWVDEPEPEKVRKTKEVVKRAPPERTWEHPDYLPGLEAALRFDVALFTDQELVDAAISREKMVWDIECYSKLLPGLLSVTSQASCSSTLRCTMASRLTGPS